MIGLNRPKIVILGAGYGGIMTAVRLQKDLKVDEADVVLVNKHNYHYQTTWLHENAAGTLHHDKTRIPIADCISKSKTTFVQDTVVKVVPDEKRVILANGELTYDYLVVGLGFESETFGIKGLKEHAFSISSINAARMIREHIEYQFAVYNNEKERRDERLTLIVGGAGFTGIEFVGELANRVPQLCKEYDIPREKVRIINVEAAPTALPGFDPELVEYAMNLLESKGVEFKIGTMIKECTPEGIVVEKDEKVEEIKASTVVWAAGVRGSDIVDESGFETMRGRVKVRKDMRDPNRDEVFIVGDCALIINEETNRPYPPTAQIAIQQASTVSHNLTSLIRGKQELETFTPDLKGTVASLGEGEAIGVIFGNKKIFGRTASMMKKVIDNRYLMMLGGIPMVLKKGKLKMF